MIYANTPTVTVLDNRGLAVREITYHRHPSTPEVTAERITRHQYDARGFPAQSADPRLHAAGRANFTYLTDLTGNVLRTQSADAGITLALNDAVGRPFMAVSNIETDENGAEDHRQAVTRTWQYEDDTLPGRPLAVTEQVTGEAARVMERLVWADSSEEAQKNNLAGQCISHYDTAGLVRTDSIALSGVPLSVSRCLLKDADNTETVADWQGEDASAWNILLDTGAHTTRTIADATGTVLITTDAAGNLQRVAYDVAGLLKGSWLTLKGGAEQVIVKSLTYSAAGQKLREEHGNGVVTSYTYEPGTQRLTGIKTERLAGYASGAKVLQDLRYAYDPVGNVLSIRNDAEETRFWRNQKVVPENRYAYDSLYQLISASGREMANAGQQGRNLPSVTVPLLADSSAYTNYTRTYSYDSGGNLIQIRHSAPATNNSYTTNITVSERSNRGVLNTLTENSAEVDALFTAGGQQKQLQAGQNLVWTPRGELLRVAPVTRDGTREDDSEGYRYDADSQRIIKVSTQQTASSIRTQQVVYLPGLELRTAVNNGTETENLQVITVGEAGRAQVRALHWESGKPDSISNDQLRWSYDNFTGSSGLEADGDGGVISVEEYYPYGGTALWAARNQVEASYKTIRYSGKERDATGLYYYGYRYYQPWVARWLSADPAGTVDGLNLFRMVRNNPVSFFDPDGRKPKLLSPEQGVLDNLNNVVIPFLLSRREQDKASAERRVREKFNLSGQQLGEALESFYDKISTAPLSFNFKPDEILLLHKDKDRRLKNTWELNSRTDENYKRLRNDVENIIMDISGGGEIYKDKRFQRAFFSAPSHYAPMARQKYGSISFDDHKGGAASYGSGAMFLNDELKGNMTFTAWDSYSIYRGGGKEALVNSTGFQGNLYPLIANSSDKQLNQLHSLISSPDADVDFYEYYEWQSHAPIYFKKGVSSLALNSVIDNKQILAITKEFTKTNKINWLDKPVKR
ncbi:Putative insecticidal toxin complex [Pseudomonas chlororaphis subsp. piscium]|uniref:RHS repeat domain-containing protein n=1 Tax=Pseudomonas chlororaphis TaxID=587753 RepID=UPI000F6D702B|nr:RHS repeat domain-containing protein [Pseudomonas chlororaphis]AZC51705.1 Putative insecticidal toxin complex [Pseudomonas chlororaphis subsp. piscium]